MTLWLPFSEITATTPVDLVGGKALQLAALQREGYLVPQGGCLTTLAFKKMLSHAGFRETLAMELHRKSFEEMRWEEIWDTSLRIRNRFLKVPWPQDLEKDLREFLKLHFLEGLVTVRSSAPAEDGARLSFAGLHDSFVGLSGIDAILKHIRLVWASLWSDRALLYRRELKLSIEDSTMGVVVQAFVDGKPSGVAFSQNPLDPGQAVVEAVPGRGEDMVDGALPPDRWILDRKSGGVLKKEVAAERETLCLTDFQAQKISTVSRELEALKGTPQDVEWTIDGGELYLLQTRAITGKVAVDPHGEDRRGWYLTLTRSLPELRKLHKIISEEIIPGMEAMAKNLAADNLDCISDCELKAALQKRQEITRHWVNLYWEYCIPFAHGMRLFGQIYNDRLQPSDPYEFVDVLSGDRLICLDRNRLLTDLGRASASYRDGSFASLPDEIKERFNLWIDEFGMGLSLSRNPEEMRQQLFVLAGRMAEAPETHSDSILRRQDLENRFLNAFSEDENSLAAELLRIGRASYALRDNDNHYLEMVRAEEKRAENELKRRDARANASGVPMTEDSPKKSVDISKNSDGTAASSRSIRGKQLVGQPSSPGIATGPARVIRSQDDILNVLPGEVLICDAISPTMTFVVPIVAAIVERRGGMLIHGAIIAREYGIPCVTGVQGATDLVETGLTVSVDGYLGVVIIRIEERGV